MLNFEVRNNWPVYTAHLKCLEAHCNFFCTSSLQPRSLLANEDDQSQVTKAGDLLIVVTRAPHSAEYLPNTL